VRQALAIARNSLVEVTANVWFGGVLVAAVIWVVFLIDRIPGGPLEMSPLPVTMLVTTALSRDYVVGLYILICFFAGEMLWKDRDAGVAEIADAAPVAEGTALAGRFLALMGVLGILMATSMVAGMLGQLGRGYSDLEPWLYLRVLFGMNLANGALVVALMVTVHVVVNHKYLGTAASLMALGIPFLIPLLPNATGDPGWMYSYMNGFGPFLAPFAWFKLYLAGYALVALALACVLWVRGRESGLRHRLREARARFTRPLRLMAGVGVAFIVTAGGVIVYNTRVLNAAGVEGASAASVEYEKRYARFASASQPTIERARVHAEIHPDNPAVDLRGSFRLVNRTGVPIDSVHLTTNRRLATRSIAFDRDAKAVVTDDETGYRIYSLARPLAPGDSLELTFDLGFRQRGFPSTGIQTDIVENGTQVTRDWLPSVGYRPAGDRAAESDVRVETTAGTSADQIAVAPGVLRREWNENGRRYFHYEMETAQPFDFAVFSARYAVRTDRWSDTTAASGQGVVLGVYHHPDHDRNLETIVRGMKASLSYYTKHFGPYGGSVLRIVETPRYEKTARAHPTIVAFSEHAFLARTDTPIDQLFFATAHEIAHQWWGAIDAHGSSGVLSRMLANYGAMMVTEAAYGAAAARRIYAYHMDGYFTSRGSSQSEVPLLAVEAQPSYRKGLLAMYLMRDYIGEEAVDTAVRRLLDKHRGSALPSATVRDLVNELRAVTPDSLQYLITDLFETVTVWTLRTDRAAVEPTATGEYRVTIDVFAKKLRPDGAGKDVEVPMDDMVDVGVFGYAPGEPLYLKSHGIRGGTQTISITVPEKPARVEVDPFRKLIERVGRDNAKAIEGGSPSSKR
jgi:hypothetical protein